MAILNTSNSPEIKRLERQISDLSFCVRELVTELTIRRLPERRLLNLRQEWILAFCRGECRAYNPGNTDVSLRQLQWSVCFEVPSGMTQTPTFFVLPDDEDHRELLLANRLECVICIANSCYMTPTAALLHIESCGNPLERLALQARN
jgi:hypothetical protein